MPNNQKRKRKRTSDAVAPNAEEKMTPVKKKARRSGPEPEKTEKTPVKTPKKTPKTANQRKKERHKERSPRKKRKFPKRKRLLGKTNKKYHKRRRTRLLRQLTCRAIERALVEGPKIPLIYHLFTSLDSMGNPRAPLNAVLKQLKISNFVKNSHFLTDAHFKSLHKFTTVFNIEKDEPDGGLWLKFWPSSMYDKEAATVYVDNLPEGCNEMRLMRLAECYGTVVSLSIGKKPPRMIRPKHHRKKKHHNPNVPVYHHIHRIPPKPKPLIDIGSRPRQFGFIRFVEVESARRMIQKFIVNDPSRLYQKFQDEQRREEALFEDDEFLEFGLGDEENLGAEVRPRPFPRFRPFSELALSKMLLEIRYLKARRKRRTYPMWRRLAKLERRLYLLEDYEVNCLRKAGILPKRKRRKPRRRELPPPQLEDISDPSEEYVDDPIDWIMPEENEPGPAGEVVPPERAHSFAGSAGSPDASMDTPPDEEQDEEPMDQGSPEDAVIFHERKPKRKRAHRKPKKKKKKKRMTDLEEMKLKVKRKRRKYKRKWREERSKRRKWLELRALKRRRKHPNRKKPKFILGRSVHKYFDRIQVLAKERYLQLKAEYLQLREQERQRVREQAQIPPQPDDVPEIDL